MFVIFLGVVFSRLLEQHEEKSFITYMREHNLLYTGEEYHFRLGIYLTNFRYVRRFNGGNHGFLLRMNSLATLTSGEYRFLIGRIKPIHRFCDKKLIPQGYKDPPDSWDWREKGAVQVVKDQGACGSNPVFTAVACQESMWAIQRGTLYNLSEQNIIDCDPNSGGCDGGFGGDPWSYVLQYQNGNFTTEDKYPYTGVTGKCYWDPSMATTYFTNINNPCNGNEDTLLNVIWQQGPAESVVDASHISFQLYSGGIYDDPSCTTQDLDHSLCTVGYGSENGNDYWICKNTWGTEWGEQGYIRMSRNKNNQCGIAVACTYPYIA